MKKALVFFCFIAGAVCFLSAGLYINKQKAGLEDEYAQESVTKVKSPELLSEIKIPSYVSLPASFSDINIEEDLNNIDVTENNVDTVMYEQLFKTAQALQIIEGSDKTIIADYTITKDNQVQKVESGATIGYQDESSMYDENVYKGLQNAAIGKTLHFENVMFDGISDATLDITINAIYDMPYPVSDKYISENTEYKSVYDMKAALMNDASGEAKEIAREHTINTLIDTMMKQTTFIKLPESLVMKELEALQKENENATYDDAKHSLYKIFFIATVIDNYDIATKTDIEKRYANLDESERENLTSYEIERKKYLLFEEDVVICIYKKVSIQNNSN